MDFLLVRISEGFRCKNFDLESPSCMRKTSGNKAHIRCLKCPAGAYSTVRDRDLQQTAYKVQSRFEKAANDIHLYRIVTQGRIGHQRGKPQSCNTNGCVLFQRGLRCLRLSKSQSPANCPCCCCCSEVCSIPLQ